MNDDVYERLADALDRLPNGFPRTPSRGEIEILRRIFSPEEASLAGHLRCEADTVDVVSDRVGLPAESIAERLGNMAKRGLVWVDKRDEGPRYRLAPFIVGIYESQREDMDHELAHLVERYLKDGGLEGIMKPQPTIHRVVPAQSAVNHEWILPYDDVRAILLKSRSFSVCDCICRVQQDNVGRKCDFPLRVCLSFSSLRPTPDPESISQEEALAILDQTEEIGLVHTVSNVMKGIGYVCNCCGCCCVFIRGIAEMGIENSVAYANYYAVIDPDECLGCGTCVERCHVNAISDQDGTAVVERERCIGCGLCVTGCPNDVAQLQLKPEEEIVPPPADFAVWEEERLHNRGLID
jgi:ferredoxin